MGYYEIKVYFIIYQSNALASKYFENSWLKFFRQLSNVTEGYFDKTRSFTFNIKSNQ